MEIISQKIKVLNEDVFYLHKPSTNPTVNLLFLHGFPFSSTMWQGQLKALPENVEAFALDFPGFGNSTTFHHFLSIDYFVKRLFSFCDSLQLNKVVLCGLSMGGYVALRAMEIASERIAGLILCDTHSLSDGNEAKINRFNAIDTILSGNKVDFIKGSIKNLFAETSLVNNTEGVELVKAMMFSTTDETICAAQLALAARTDTSKILPDIKVPTLIVRGEQDKLMTEKHFDMLINEIVNSEGAIIPNAGHLPNIENQQSFNNSILSFLDKHFH